MFVESYEGARHLTLYIELHGRMQEAAHGTTGDGGRYRRALLRGQQSGQEQVVRRPRLALPRIRSDRHLDSRLAYRLLGRPGRLPVLPVERGDVPLDADQPLLRGCHV